MIGRERLLQSKWTSVAVLVVVLIEISNIECQMQRIVRKTPLGNFHGVRRDVKTEIRVDIFLGIRYGEAPINEKRFKEVSMPAYDRDTYHSATDLPPSCNQALDTTFGSNFQGSAEWNPKGRLNEDCLFLNIWQPVRTVENNAIKQPVIVWIYGGAFQTGSSTLDLYNGTYLAAHSDAVVVSFQYRLGALGFLYTGDDFAPGNAGLKDQVLALKWVNEYIEYFGGDKDKITLIGESAGSGSVGYHLLSPETSKLFKRAVLLSGAPISEWASIPPSEAKRRTIDLAVKLGADRYNYEDVKNTLLQRRPWEIVEKQMTSFSDHEGIISLPFAPTIEPSLVPEHPIEMLRKASHLKGKELIVSWTKDEGSYFVIYALKEKQLIDKPTDEPVLYRNQLQHLLAMLVHNDLNATESLMKLYGREPYLQSITSAVGDYYFKCPINMFIEELKRHNAIVYRMEYDYRSAANAWPKWAGSMHGYELEMLFSLPTQSSNNLYNYVDQKMCKRFQSHIENFVQKGNPNYSSTNQWSRDSIYSLSQQTRNVDDRSYYCMTLKHEVPGYLDGTTQLRGSTMTMLLILIILKVLFLLQ